MKNRNALQNGGQLSLLKCIHNCPATLAGKMLQPQSSRGGRLEAITPTTVIRRTYYGVDCALLFFFFLCSFRPFTFSFIYNFDFLLCLWLSRNDESSPSRVELKVAVWLHLNYCIKEKSLSTAISAAQREEEVGRGGRWRWSSPPGIAIK